MALRMWGAVFASGVAAVFMAGTAIAGEAPSPFLNVHGKTLAPLGFVAFCAGHSEDCRPLKAKAKRPGMTAQRRKLISDVNTLVNARIEPVSDKELYGEAEHWTYPVDAGDCEDFVLLKKRYLMEAGIPAGALPITVVLDEKGEGHAVLMFTAKDGDYVLDNRRDGVLRWDETGYQFLKRQSAEDPRIWVSLTGEEGGETRPAVSAGSN